MRRLTPEQSDALLAVMRKAAGKPFDEVQALRDCEAVVGALPRLKEAQDERARKRKRAPKGRPLRILIELAAEPWHIHTGKGPGASDPEYIDPSMKRGAGLYPEFVRILGKAVLALASKVKVHPYTKCDADLVAFESLADMDVDLKTVANTCRNMRTALNQIAKKRAKENPKFGDITPKEQRGKLLATHSVGYEDADHFPNKIRVIGRAGPDPKIKGYQPGPEPDAAKVFAGLITKK